MNVIKNIIRRQDMQNFWKVNHYDMKKMFLPYYERVMQNMRQFALKEFPDVVYERGKLNIDTETINSVFDQLKKKLVTATKKVFYKNYPLSANSCLENTDLCTMTDTYFKEILLETAVQFYIYAQFFIPVLLDMNRDSSEIYNPKKLFDIWHEEAVAIANGKSVLDTLGDNWSANVADSYSKNMDNTVDGFIRSVYTTCADVCIIGNFTYEDFLAMLYILIGEYEGNHDEEGISDEVAAEFLKKINTPDLDYRDLLFTHYTRDCTKRMVRIMKETIKSEQCESGKECGKEEPEKKETKERGDGPNIGDEILVDERLFRVFADFNNLSEKAQDSLLTVISNAMELAKGKSD